MGVSAARRIRWSREQPYRAVGENAVNIEKNNFDFQGAKNGICHWHQYLVFGI
jgi:hypothetical protein